MKRVYVCKTGSKNRVYIIEDDQQMLFAHSPSFTIRYGKTYKWLRSKLVFCESLADKEKKIAEIDNLRKRHGYSLDFEQ